MTDEEILKFDSLKEEYSQEFVEFLKEISIQCDRSFEYIYSKLPSSELVRKDEEFVKRSEVASIASSYSKPISYRLTFYYIGLGTLPSGLYEDPYVYYSGSLGYAFPPFSKDDFLKSIKSGQEKKLIRKK